jgi:Zn-dependent protease
MKQTIRLGRAAGIPVGMHWSVAVIVALIAGILGTQVLPQMAPGEPTAVYWAVAVPGALLFVAALLAHELAHAFVARRARVGVRSITLWALGGVAELTDDPPTARADLRIAVAGPATSLAAAAVFGALAALVQAAGGPRILGAAFIWLCVMNALLAVFNLLPGAPLDGGRILRALLWMRHGDRSRAARTAAGAGRIVGGALAGLGLFEVFVWGDAGGLWLLIIGFFLVTAATAEADAQIATDALGGLLVRDVMTPEPAIGAGWISVADFIDRVALDSAQSVFPVVGLDGTLIGVAGLDRLCRLPAATRAVTVLRDVTYRVPPAYLARPGDAAGPLLARRPLAGELTAVVTEDGRIVGLVTTENMRQAVRRAQLRGKPLHGTPA